MPEPGGPGPGMPQAPAPGQPVKPPVMSELPGIPAALLSPSNKPGVSVTAPPQGPLGQQASGAVTPQQDTIRILDALAQGDNEAAAEWARMVLASLLGARG